MSKLKLTQSGCLSPDNYVKKAYFCLSMLSTIGGIFLSLFHIPGHILGHEGRKVICSEKQKTRQKFFTLKTSNGGQRLRNTA